MMKNALYVFCTLALTTPFFHGKSAFAALDEKASGEAIALRQQGEFEKASRALQDILDQSSATLEMSELQQVEFEIERIRRIRQDYRLTREKLLEQLRRRLTEMSDEEFDRLEREGNFDIQVIDGQKLYVNTSASNLILKVPELRNRLKERKPDTMYRRLYNNMLRAKAAGQLTSSPLVLPQDYQVTYTLVIEPNAAPAGSTVRAWLPFARAFPHQTNIHLLQSDPPTPLMAPLQYPHRTVYLEKQAVADQPTTFSIGFIYRSWARLQSVSPDLVQPYQKDAPEYTYYTAEKKPHIDFSNEDMKRLSGEIVAGETNPYRIARRIYDWIGRNTIYQYAREYSTLDNLSWYCASRRAGDCGQHGMLFIALCRMNGVPARWTTGWESFNDRGNNMHDWCEFYVEPYGWLPADPDMAVNILRHVDDELTTAQSEELADWLFGNMDNHRLTVNSDFSAPLFPPKQDFRSETVDFQRGEVEADGKNLYFDKWDYTMRMKPIEMEKAMELAAPFIPSEIQGLLDVKGSYRPETPPAPATQDATTTATDAATTATDTATTGIISTAPADGATTSAMEKTGPTPVDNATTSPAAADSATTPPAAQ